MKLRQSYSNHAYRLARSAGQVFATSDHLWCNTLPQVNNFLEDTHHPMPTLQQPTQAAKPALISASMHAARASTITTNTSNATNVQGARAAASVTASRASHISTTSMSAPGPLTSALAGARAARAARAMSTAPSNSCAPSCAPSTLLPGQGLAGHNRGSGLNSRAASEAGSGDDGDDVAESPFSEWLCICRAKSGLCGACCVQYPCCAEDE